MNQPLQEDLDFLEHFGVKGQKWGVRKQKQTTSDQPKKSHTKRNVAIGVAVVVGAAATAMILKNNKNLKIRNMTKRLNDLEGSKRLIDAHRDIRLQDINKAHRAGKIDTAQAWKLADLTQRDMNNKLGRAAVRAGVNPVDRFGLHPKTIRSLRGSKQVFKSFSPHDIGPQGLNNR